MNPIRQILEAHNISQETVVDLFQSFKCLYFWNYFQKFYKFILIFSKTDKSDPKNQILRQFQIFLWKIWVSVN